ERRGPRVGLLASAGHRPELIDAGYLSPDLVLGVREPLDPDAVAASIEQLLDRGARVIAVSLDGSWRDPSAERAVRSIVRGLYPTYYVGSVRVFLASDVSVLPGVQARTNTIVLNALVHDYLARSVYPAEEKLRRRGMRCPLLLVNGHAGLARSAKTLAIHTHNSGPAAGVSGAAALADSLRAASGLVVTLDIGGTSSDVSVADSSSLAVAWTKELEGLRVHAPSVAVEALPYGGGTIAWASGREMRLGPQSAGAHPGPACFDRGGEQATVTDANLTLGFLDPGGFHGGRLELRRELAQKVLEELGRKLGLEAAELARRMRDAMDEGISTGIAGLLRRRSARPEAATLVAYGGGGPLHAASIAGLVGIRHVVVPAMSSVFSALGVSKLDVQHLYPVSLDDESPVRSLERVLDAAARDVKAEGFSVEAAVAKLEAVNQETGEALWRHDGMRLPEASRALSSVLDQVVSIAKSSGDVLLVLTTVIPSHREEGRHAKPAAVSGAGAAAGERAVDWGAGSAPTAIHPASSVSHGQKIAGPALVVSGDQTIAVPPGWSLTRRESGDFHLETKA
ncbi:MAG: hydantoinase/oxoprolinase family protein, partial [Steroidobacteraceae bacterium]|nr:hydantoinase/oxoprolinase family protein [Steroidobacteraceae bacterium]